MTEQNKPIIIDGVDVSGCDFHCGLIMDCTLAPLQKEACENNPNCYYKQLQRMKQDRNNFKKKYRKERVKRIKLEETLREIKIHAHIGFSICNECEEKIRIGDCSIECGAHKLLSRINGMIK